jgi:predicted ATP-grasp superfamily ATP-dependent carboligase
MPVPITGLASDEDLVDELGLQRSNYEGPTGIVGVLHDSCNKRGISSASLWAAIPHYVAAVPNPKAALALLRRLEGLVGVALEASGLEEETESYENQVTTAVEQNPEIAEMVERLEAEQAEAFGEDGEDVPSGESLARDFERFLRQQGGPGEQGPAQS